MLSYWSLIIKTFYHIRISYGIIRMLDTRAKLYSTILEKIYPISITSF